MFGKRSRTGGSGGQVGRKFLPRWIAFLPRLRYGCMERAEQSAPNGRLRACSPGRSFLSESFGILNLFRVLTKRRSTVFTDVRQGAACKLGTVNIRCFRGGNVLFNSNQVVSAGSALLHMR